MAKAAKLPIAMLRGFERNLQAETPNAQIEGLISSFDTDDEARQAVIAAAVLAHTKKGSPLARGVLASIAEAKSSDAFVRHCATLDRGHDAVVDALARVWKLATDTTALEAVYANFARVYFDRPMLLELGVEAARRRGDATVEAERAGELAQLRSLEPLLAELAGSDAAKKQARPKVGALAAADRRRIYLAIIGQPTEFAEALAIEAVDALLLDPSVSESAIMRALGAMKYHGAEELETAWKARVKAGDGGLIARLVRLLEWMSERADDEDQLEHLIHSLWPVGNRPDVHALIVGLLGSTNPVAQLAVCEEWIRETEGREVFEPAQMDRLIRIVGKLAEPGEDGDDVARAANRALFYGRHAGARTAMMELIRNANPTQTPKLRWNCYFGLADSDPEIRAFMIERLFDERDEYWALLDWFEERTDMAVHRDVIAALQARKTDPSAIHAATAYFDAMYAKKHVPRLAIRIANEVADWSPRTQDDARRLRYVLEAATASALKINDLDAARGFLERLAAKALDVKPYSDYQIDRDKPTASPLATTEVKKQLAALKSGKLDAALTALRETAEAARSKGKPIALTDEQLGQLAGCTVSGRLLDDRTTKSAWFYDEVGDLHVYDGYTVRATTEAGFEWHKLAWDVPPVKLLGPVGSPADDRALFMTAKARAFREVERFGEWLLVHDTHGGPNWTGRARVGAVGLRFEAAVAAHEAFARFEANPPKDQQPGDAWYRDKRGAITREYVTCDRAADRSQTCVIMVLGTEVRGGDPEVPKTHPTHEAAVAAVEAWEARIYAGGGRLTEIGVDSEATIRADTTIAAFFEERYRDDGKDAVWHARAIGEMVQALQDANLVALVPDLVAHAGPPATEAEIAAYQALVPEPLPEPLLAVWRAVGGFGFSSTTTKVRFLAPNHLVASRDALREQVRTWASATLKGSRKAALLGKLDHYDPLAFVDGAPVTIYDTRLEQDDGRCFCGPDSGWWEKALGWTIATDVTIVLKQELERRVGDIYRLRLGQRASAETVRTQLISGGKTFEAIVDGKQTMTRTMTKAKPGKPSVKTHADASTARAFFDAVVAAQKKQGWKRSRA